MNIYPLVRKSLFEIRQKFFMFILHCFWILLISYTFLLVYSKILSKEVSWVFYYILLAQLFRSSFTRVYTRISDEYLDGRIDDRLLKPYPLILQYFVEYFLYDLLKFLISVLFVNIVLLIFSLKLVNLLLALISYLFFYFPYFLCYYTIGLSVAWLKDNSPLVWLFQKLDMIVQLIPKEFFFFSIIYVFLPGYYSFYIPISIYFGKLDNTLSYAIFLVMIFSVALYFEKIFIRKIEIYGG